MEPQPPRRIRFLPIILKGDSTSKRRKVTLAPFFCLAIKYKCNSLSLSAKYLGGAIASVI